ncbi:MAG: hypothetical protein L0Y56_15400 [Nitrospira sp.]|nr:hypothetical protein [Nitrospira sp.]
MKVNKTMLNILLVSIMAVFLSLGILGLQSMEAREYKQEDYEALFKELPKSKLSLADGIRQVSKSPEAATSAKFELKDGKLMLSVYTAEKGLTTDSEHNVLKEYIGSPEGEKWNPEVEVFKDAEHLKRSAEHLTLVAVSPHSLLDIIAKAEKQQPGTVFSITPVVQDRKPQFVVLVADKDKLVALRYDLMTGEPVKK